YNKRYKNLSGGQKRRVDIIKALLHKPKILVLDEPTTGIDPEMRADLWKAIHKIRNEFNLTVILITHYLEEMNDVDLLIALIEGQIRFTGDTKKFVSDYGISSVSLQFKRDEIQVFK